MYRRVGTYRGNTQPLADRSALFGIAWAPSNYGITTDLAPAIISAYRDDVPCIPGDWANAMIVHLQPAAYIPLHKDIPLEEGLERYHLVLQTNNDCWNFHDGVWQQLELGGVYVMDPLQKHGSLNWGTTQRIHLVVDVVPALVAA